MDAIEATRQRAASLFREAVAAGAPEYDLFKRVVWEARRRDLEVRGFPKGHDLLRGGRALLDADADLILHEVTGSRFEDAFLIAHEIAHHVFGGLVRSVPTIEADPMRQAGGSTRSEGQVVDYHRRDRREVQMDMFAREFLVPRFVVRKMHLEDGLSASDIAARLDAPDEIVAVQLFDGLFLPEVAQDVQPAQTLKPLNPEQVSAANHTGSAFLLEAGPGTGKTQTLVGRVLALQDRGVDPESILVLTFSNKAAGEMLDRITVRWPEAAGALWTGTFHSFGYDLIKRFHKKLGLDGEPRLIDQAEAVALLEDEFPRLDLHHFKDVWDPTQTIRDLLSAISRANDEVVSPDEFMHLAEKMLAEAMDAEAHERAEKTLECAKVYAAYTALKKERGVLDFGDLVQLPVLLLEAYEDVRTYLADRYTHVLVDEYQDVNRASVRLLKGLKPTGEGLWVVGDPKQSIYRFRGASSLNVSRFSVDFPGAKTGQLSRNYRSSAEICATVKSFASTQMGASGERFEFVAQRDPSGTKPVFSLAASKDHEVDLIAQQITADLENGISLRDQAVLCKGNDRLAEIAKGLAARGVPILYLGPLFDRAEVKDMLSLLSLIVDPLAMGLVRAAQLPEFQMPVEDVDCILDHLKQADQTGPLNWTRIEPSELGLSDQGVSGLTALQKVFAEFGADASAWDVLRKLLFEHTSYGARLALGLLQGRPNPAIAIWQLQNFIRAVRPGGKGLSIKRLLEHICRLVTLSDERDLRELPPAASEIDAVRLMTIHGSKGLEFRSVHLPSLASGVLPRAFQTSKAPPLPDGMIEGFDGTITQYMADGHQEEQACVFFVALSRAESALRLYSPGFQGQNRRRSPSPYIGELEGIEYVDLSANASRTESHETPSALPVRFDEHLQMTLSQLGLFERCPRRFFYTHVLRIGGRRRETPFMQMHTAVQDVVSQINASTDAPVDDDAAMAMFDEAWKRCGPLDHGYAADYRRIAVGLVKTLLTLRRGHQVQAAPPIHYEIGGLTIAVRADAIEVTQAGRKLLRRVRTGKSSKSVGEGWEAAIVQSVAAQEGIDAEIVFLANADVVPLEMKARKLGNRLEALRGVGDAITSGQFPPKPGRNCPQCPAFFICGELPYGELKRKNIN